MQLSLLLLAAAGFLVGCNSTGSPSINTGAGGPRFSWEKEAQPVTAPEASRALIVAVRADLSLLELVREGKAEPKSRLQLTKSGQNFLVEVISSDDKSTIVAIVPNQAVVPVLHAGEDLPCSVVAAP